MQECSTHVMLWLRIGSHSQLDRRQDGINTAVHIQRVAYHLEVTCKLKTFLADAPGERFKLNCKGTVFGSFSSS